MNRLTKLALRIFGIRVKRPANGPKTWAGTMDEYDKLIADGKIDNETLYAIVGTSPKAGWIDQRFNSAHMPRLPDAIDVTTIDGPSFAPIDLFKHGGTGYIQTGGFGVYFKDGEPTQIDVFGNAYKVTSNKPVAP